MIVAFPLENCLVELAYYFVVSGGEVLLLKNVVLYQELEDVSRDGEQNDDRYYLKPMVEVNAGLVPCLQLQDYSRHQAEDA